VHKIGALVAQTLRARHGDLTEHLLAHSGAVIGVGHTVGREVIDGEVPRGAPTIMQQLSGFVGDPADVPVVLVNGGINDVDIRNILNPFVAIDALRASIEEHCFDSMRVLLQATRARFPHASTRIVVTSYYPILGPLSTPFRIPRVLIMNGIHPMPELAAAPGFFDLIVERCQIFWRESTACLQRAVEEVDAASEGPPLLFVDAGFGQSNAIFADDPWLWGLNRDLSPQDEVILSRHLSCDAAVPWADAFAREQCYRASVGHPNIKGAQRYAERILAALAT
jgi:hypothetical protein